MKHTILAVLIYLAPSLLLVAWLSIIAWLEDRRRARRLRQFKEQFERDHAARLSTETDRPTGARR